MSLIETPQTIQWPVTHYVFVEKKGHFMETAPAAWGQLHKAVPEIQKNSQISKFLSLYVIKPEMIYRAGVAVDSKPSVLPEGFQYEEFQGGAYACFVLKGSYSQLPQACGRVFQIVAETKIPVRSGFYIENYVNDPKVTPEADLLTEILIPVQS